MLASAFSWAIHFQTALGDVLTMVKPNRVFYGERLHKEPIREGVRDLPDKLYWHKHAGLID